MKNLRQNIIAILLLCFTLGFIGCGEKKADGNAEVAGCDSDNIVVTLDEADYQKMDSDTCWANATKDSIAVELGTLVDSIAKLQKTLKTGEVLRIQGAAAISWKGVSGCCTQNTVNQKAKQAIEAFVGQQILANRPHLYYRSGLIGPVLSAKCSSKTDWRGVRKCKGSWKQPYYIEFIKQ